MKRKFVATMVTLLTANASATSDTPVQIVLKKNVAVTAGWKTAVAIATMAMAVPNVTSPAHSVVAMVLSSEAFPANVIAVTKAKIAPK